ncbi:MAG: SDR family NAD(P)-dependent oxidoreductase [Planctomycetales bacterium]|nr:SDR family NAD(P)-dependent oxidoreductase [Planctomycetales bacterium]
MSRRELRGCRIIVTGASSGIGYELTQRLLAAGANVLATARRADRLQSLATDVAVGQQRLVIHPGDVTDATTRSTLVEIARQAWDGLDGVINNAGTGAIGRFDQAEESRVRQIFEVNFFAPVELTRLALPLLSAGQTPFVTNIGSVLGHVAMPMKSEYCASKFALRGWSDALASELRGRGIDVVWVAPNTTRSEFFDNLIEVNGQAAVNPLSMSSELVARKIVTALQRRRTRLLLTASGRALLVADFVFPRLLRRLLSR